MPLIGINEIIDVTPWKGWEINPRPSGAAGDWQLGPLRAFGRVAELVSEGGWLTLLIDNQPVFSTDIVTRLSQIALREDGIDLETWGGGTIALATGGLHSAKFNGRDLAIGARQGAAAVTLAVLDQPGRLELRRT